MALNDISQTQDDQTVYVWGGYSPSGFHNDMIKIDIATGASTRETLGLVEFLAQGFVTNANWAWTPGKLIYLDAGGAMTQTRPASGPVTILGIAYSATTICFDPRPPKGN